MDFLTTEENNRVKPHHENGMPVMLTNLEERYLWLSSGEKGLRLQRLPYRVKA